MVVCKTHARNFSMVVSYQRRRLSPRYLRTECQDPRRSSENITEYGLITMGVLNIHMMLLGLKIEAM